MGQQDSSTAKTPDAKPMAARSSPHVHTQFCDGKSTAREMLMSALARGFVSLGFSSHAKQTFDQFYAMDDAGEDLYLAEIGNLQEEFKGRIRIWRGMERDLYSYADRKLFDYVIGSVHNIPCPDGLMLPVDADPKLLRDGITRYFSGSGIRFTQAYYALLGAYIKDYQPDIIGHFDLPTKFNECNEFFSENDPDYIVGALRAMVQAILGCRLMEVNTGAMARIGKKRPYPSLELLLYWRKLGGEVILSSDCHDARLLDAGYDQALHLIKEAGYKKAAILGRQETLFEWVGTT